MGKVASDYDNSMMESFFGFMRIELFDRRTWATRALSAACDQKKWDSWVRDVAVSPDGSYAVVANSGGPRAKTPCDGAVRLGLNTRSTRVKPTWIASAGGDTLSAVAIGAKVVYVGGHQRWLNNNGGRAQAFFNTAKVVLVLERAICSRRVIASISRSARP